MTVSELACLGNAWFVVVVGVLVSMLSWALHPSHLCRTAAAGAGGAGACGGQCCNPDSKSWGICGRADICEKNCWGNCGIRGLLISQRRIDVAIGNKEGRVFVIPVSYLKAWNWGQWPTNACLSVLFHSCNVSLHVTCYSIPRANKMERVSHLFLFLFLFLLSVVLSRLKVSC